MSHKATTSLLQRARRRLWAENCAQLLKRGAWTATLVLGVAGAASIAGLRVPLGPVCATAALVLAVAGLAGAWRGRPGADETARAADRWLDAPALFVSASDQLRRPAALRAPAADFVLGRAETTAEAALHSAAFGRRLVLSALFRGLGVPALVGAACAVAIVAFAPPPRQRVDPIALDLTAQEPESLDDLSLGPLAWRPPSLAEGERGAHSDESGGSGAIGGMNDRDAPVDEPPAEDSGGEGREGQAADVDAGGNEAGRGARSAGRHDPGDGAAGLATRPRPVALDGTGAGTRGRGALPLEPAAPAAGPSPDARGSSRAVRRNVARGVPPDPAVRAYTAAYLERHRERRR